MNDIIKEKNLLYFPTQIAFIIGIVGAISNLLVSIMIIQRSAVSTASIGYLFLPIEFIFYLLIFGVFGFLLGIVIRGFLMASYRKRVSFILALIISSLLSIYFIIDKIQVVIIYNRIQNIAMLQNPSELKHALLKRPYLLTDAKVIYIIAAIAQNSHADSELLDQIAHLDNRYLHARLADRFLNLTSNNPKGLSTARLVVRNPNVDVKTLVYLSSAKDFYLLGDIAMNRAAPRDLLYKLYEISKTHENGYLIRWGLLENPNTPSEIQKLMKNS